MLSCRPGWDEDPDESYVSQPTVDMRHYPDLQRKAKSRGHSSCLPTSQHLLRDRLHSCPRQDINKAFDGLCSCDGRKELSPLCCATDIVLHPRTCSGPSIGKRLEFQQENTPSSPAAFALHLVRVLAPPFSLLAKKNPETVPCFP